jgi:CubicO group peptidase (beta-lactamase class C family)
MRCAILKGNNRSRALWLPVLLLLLGCSTTADGAQTTELETELASIVAEFRGDNDRFGVLFARFDGHTPTVRVSGDIRPDDHLRLGSVSKVFLGFMVLREGLSPDATIAAFYPGDRYPHADAITGRMLLDHTSGIPDEMGRRMRELGPGVDPAEVLRALQPMMAAPAPPPDERIDAIYDHEIGLDFEPGTLWCYSNTGYVMLGRMLERSTGQPIERLLARHFGGVAPSLYLDDGRDANFPASYLNPWPIHWSQPWVAGALIATAADAVAAFHHMAEHSEFQLMQQWAIPPRCPADIVAGDEYGLGLQRYVFDGLGEGIGHDGHIIARSILFRLDGTSYLIHTTRPVTNPELRAIAQRLLAAQR